MQLSFFYMLPSNLLSGFMFPFRGMPDWTQALGTVIPVTHFLRLVRGALLKGQSLADMGPSLLALAIFVCAVTRSEEHTSELQSLMRISYAVFCLKKKKQQPSINCTIMTSQTWISLVYQYP